MAHELEFIDGKAQMAYAGEVPWHGFGTAVDPNLTPKQMMVAAGLDWTVSKHKLFAHLTDPADGKVKSYPSNRMALVRDTDNTILTVVGENWKPTQNEEAFSFFNKFHSAGAKMETAGSLFGGRRVWCLARLGASFTVGGKSTGDTTNGYLLFSLPHELGNSIQVRTTSVRVVCNNTLTWSLNGKTDSEYRQSHANHFDFDQAKEVVELANQRIVDQGKWSEKLLKQKFSDQDAIRFFSELVSDDTLAEFIEDEEELKFQAQFLNGNSRLGNILNSYKNAPGATPGNAWGVLNSITHFVDHVSGNRSETRLNSAWYGTGNNLKVQAVQKLEEMIA